MGGEASRSRQVGVASIESMADDGARQATGLELITSGDKIYFAERGETKRDLAEPLMRAVGGRPVLLQRFPEGASGPNFFQKRVPKNKPAWLQTAIVETPN